MTATKSLGLADELRRALKVVSPAQSNGAAATVESSSGTDIRTLDFAIMTSAYPPPRCTPVSCWFRQFIRSPSRQALQYPQLPPKNPTPTRSPTFQPSTSAPSCFDSPDRFVPGHRRPAKRQRALHGSGVGVTDATVLDTYADFACRRVCEQRLGKLHLSAAHDLYS